MFPMTGRGLKCNKELYNTQDLAQITEFISQNYEEVNKWVEKEERRIKNIILPYTKKDYEKMLEDIHERILLYKIFGY